MARRSWNKSTNPAESRPPSRPIMLRASSSAWASLPVVLPTLHTRSQLTQGQGVEWPDRVGMSMPSANPDPLTIAPLLPLTTRWTICMRVIDDGSLTVPTAEQIWLSVIGLRYESQQSPANLAGDHQAASESRSPPTRKWRLARSTSPAEYCLSLLFPFFSCDLAAKQLPLPNPRHGPNTPTGQSMPAAPPLLSRSAFHWPRRVRRQGFRCITNVSGARRVWCN